MATSGSWDYSLTAAQVIQAAYEDLGVVAPGETPATALQTLALARLNILTKQWQGNSDLAPGIKVWTRKRVNLVLAKGQQTYTIGPASTDSRAAVLLGRTTLSAAAAANATTLSITSNTDTTSFPGTTITMTASDFIGIELNDGTVHWSTISGTPASTAAINAGLASAAASGNYVWWFTSRAQRFPHIEAAYIRDENRNDTPLAVYHDLRAYELGVISKFSDGTPTAILVEPMTLNTVITLNSQPTDVTKTIVMVVLYPAEDYDSTSNDIAFPQEYYRYIVSELAFILSQFTGHWTDTHEANRKEATAFARALNPETSDLYFHSGT